MANCEKTVLADCRQYEENSLCPRDTKKTGSKECTLYREYRRGKMGEVPGFQSICARPCTNYEKCDQKFNLGCLKYKLDNIFMFIFIFIFVVVVFIAMRRKSIQPPSIAQNV